MSRSYTDCSHFAIVCSGSTLVLAWQWWRLPGISGAVLDVIFGRFNPMGKLPFELPGSMDAVCEQKEDVPYDSRNPLFGFGLTF